jgi:hypothetical protein
MSYEALDIAAQMMLRIWIRDNACVMHYIRHGFKAKVVAKGVWKTPIGLLAGTPRV